jgi:hypothetical protein
MNEKEKREYYKMQQQPKAQPVYSDTLPIPRQPERMAAPLDISSYVEPPIVPSCESPIEPQIKQHKQKPTEPSITLPDLAIRDQRIDEIENKLNKLWIAHPELQPKKPELSSKKILRWLLFCVLVGAFLYGIYLFYLSTLGYSIGIPGL